jgi:hypothetical protein
VCIRALKKTRAARQSRRRRQAAAAKPPPTLQTSSNHQILPLCVFSNVSECFSSSWRDQRRRRIARTNVPVPSALIQSRDAAAATSITLRGASSIVPRKTTASAKQHVFF